MLVLSSIVFLLTVLYLFYRSSSGRKLPPGPIGLPVVGYLPWLDGKAPHQSLTGLARKYGPICGLKLGSVYTVLLTDPRLVRLTLAKDAFTGRAPLYLTHGIMKGYGLICAEGEIWKDQRKFVSTCLKNLGMVKFGSRRDHLEARILSIVDQCVMKLRETSTTDGVDPLKILHHFMGNLINSLVFGKVYDEEDEVWKWLRHLQEDGVKHIGVAGPLNFLPFLRFLPYFGRTMRSLIDGKTRTHEIYKELVLEHRGNKDKSNSFLAAFDEEMRRRNEIATDPGHFTEAQFYHLLADLFGAGTDTTLTTLRWFILFIAVHPEEQERIREEMRQVLGNREPTLADKEDLKLLEASIMEVQRLRSVVPIGIPHGALEDAKIAEYDIPKGTMVVPLQWAIHMDPVYWDEPAEFKPQRFIAEDGSILKPEAFLPFQSGKRMCIGDELAKMLLFLFAARILHSFRISTVPNERIDLTGECGITLIPKPHRLIFVPREAI
ncbi:cytochrome P450 306a1 [Prorops nasuta]|uniref:cytochrome P450 306a1 n=1 Tax=Prorops nasuta TaxID=863751 RepID=UPI0034CFCF97